MSPTLKGAGNKTAIMHELKKHLPAGPRLVEPFAGSCAVISCQERNSEQTSVLTPRPE